MRFFLLPFLFICYFPDAVSQNAIHVIPAPRSLSPQRGTCIIKGKLDVVLAGTEKDSAEQLAEIFLLPFQNRVVYSIRQVNVEDPIFNASPAPVLVFRKMKNIQDEAYQLRVEPRRITIEAGSCKGMFYAIQTLHQLLPPETISSAPGDWSRTEIPCCIISDSPRFSYRGMHLDCSRHFFTIEFIKKYLDLMASYKFNFFHWHLTDDQGWRIQITKYPKLTSVGSQRKESMTGFYDDNTYDNTPYGGYYTQEEIKEVVAFANQRFITVIPEIEMPGHALAALAAHPEYSCTGGPFEVATKWGVFEDVFCPKDETISFLEDVLSEVCALFPGPFIHIGGDECPKSRWRNCKRCQDRIQQLGLKNEEELQHYFISRIGKFLESKGKKLMGWDEILDGGIIPGATIMSWRGTSGGITAARNGSDVVMTPGSYCYFDHYQGDPQTEPIAFNGFTPLQKVYDFEPIPFDSLTSAQQQHILGAQANLWTEYITTTGQAEYMAYPRAIALSEVLWSEKKQRNWNDFSKRLLNHLTRLDAQNINYAKSLFDLSASVLADTIDHTIRIQLHKIVDGGSIYYTLDGSEPTQQSSVYLSPLSLKTTSTIKACLFFENFQGKTLSKKYFVHLAAAATYRLAYPWKQYDGDALYGLTDGITGIPNQYNSWVGFSGSDLDIALDLKKQTRISRISVNFYNKNRDWIFLPLNVAFYVSENGKEYRLLRQMDISPPAESNSIFNCTISANHTARYVRVKALNIGKCPPGSPCEGHPAWLFADEIVVE